MILKKRLADLEKGQGRYAWVERLTVEELATLPSHIIEALPDHVLINLMLQAAGITRKEVSGMTDVQIIGMIVSASQLH